MKCKIERKSVYKLELNESEAVWLKGLMQTPMLEDGVDPIYGGPN